MISPGVGSVTDLVGGSADCVARTSPGASGATELASGSGIAADVGVDSDKLSPAVRDQWIAALNAEDTTPKGRVGRPPFSSMYPGRTFPAPTRVRSKPIRENQLDKAGNPVGIKSLIADLVLYILLPAMIAPA